MIATPAVVEWILGLTAVGGCVAIAANHATENLKSGEKAISNANELVKSLTIFSVVIGGLYLGYKLVK